MAVRALCALELLVGVIVYGELSRARVIDYDSVATAPIRLLDERVMCTIENMFMLTRLSRRFAMDMELATSDVHVVEYLQP